MAADPTFAVTRDNGDLVTVTVDRLNVFEDSPTAIVLKIGVTGSKLPADLRQAINVGPLQIEISATAGDAIAELRLTEAEALRDALTGMLQQLDRPTREGQLLAAVEVARRTIDLLVEKRGAYDEELDEWVTTLHQLDTTREATDVE